MSKLLFCIVLITGCFLAWSSYFSWNSPATKHYGYVFCESWVAKGKIPIGGLTDLVNDAKCAIRFIWTVNPVLSGQ